MPEQYKPWRTNHLPDCCICGKPGNHGICGSGFAYCWNHEYTDKPAAERDAAEAMYHKLQTSR